MATSIPTVQTKRGFIVQSSPPAEYVIENLGGKRGMSLPVGKIKSPICPRCGVSQHSHAAIGCGVSPTVAADLAALL